MTIEDCIRRYFPDARPGTLNGVEPVFFVECPGKHLHSKANRNTDAIVRYTNPDFPLVVYCVHQSCENLCQEAARGLRSLQQGMGLAKGKKYSRTKTAAQLEFSQAQNLVLGIRAKFEFLFAGVDASFLEKRALGLEESRERLFSLYADHEILWNGQQSNSGPLRGPGHFRTVGEWRTEVRFGQFTVPGIFRPGEIYRREACLLEKPRYFIAEFDKLDQDPIRNQVKTWILMHWLAKYYNLQLRLCVDSGNKSLHFWVETAEVTSMLLTMLHLLGAEKTILTHGAHPVRFPGVARTEQRLQRVIEL